MARIVREDSNPIQAMAAANTAINPGDMLWLDSSDGTVKPASAFTWTTNLATTQANFHAVFIGVSLDKRLASQTTAGLINIATRGRFKSDCATDTNARNIGTLYGPAQGTGNTLANQVVAVVDAPGRAVGRLAKAKAAADTEVVVEMVSSLVHGGVQAIASV